MKGFIEFDLPEALLTNLVRVFDSMDSAVPTQENVAQIPDIVIPARLVLSEESMRRVGASAGADEEPSEELKALLRG